jgi:hypothetical protein
MKHKTLLAGIIGIMLVLGLLITGCDNPAGNSGITEYTVAFDAAGGSVNPLIIKVNSGKTVSVLPIPTKDNNTFGGWYTQVDGGGSQFTTSTPVISDITVYAKWTNGGGGTGENGGGGNTGSVPSAPSNVYATVVSSSSISVSWSSVSGATSYDVYYEIGSSSTKNFAINVTGTSYTHSGLQSNTTYFYYIKAKNSAGSSGYSSYAYATTASVSVAGSSYSNAIIFSGGVNSSFPSGLEAVWYKFYSSGGSGIFSASDRYYSSIYTSDIVVDIYFDDLSFVYIGGIKQENIDVGGSSMINVTWPVGYYYVKVKPYGGYSSNKGSFALFFTD